MQQRKERRFKQWNKTTFKALADRRGPAGPSIAEGFTYDISLGGARIHSAEPFEVGTLLSLRIELVRTQEVVHLEGRVRWLRRSAADRVYEMGIEFQHANSQTVVSLMRNLLDGHAGASR